MHLSDWWPWYERIAQTFGYGRELDQQATDLLSNLIQDKSLRLESLAEAIRAADIIVFGAGPSLVDDISASSPIMNRYVIMAADGATTALLENGLVPDVVVTDLDGNLHDLMDAVDRGAKLVVHAHGDNIGQLREHVPNFRVRILGTTQVEPRQNVYNFGGFTDGDRCVFLAEALGAKRIVLAGMDFGNESTRYSKAFYAHHQPSETKIRKLQFGKELLEWLATRTSCEIFNLTSRGEPIKGITKIAQL